MLNACNTGIFNNLCHLFLVILEASRMHVFPTVSLEIGFVITPVLVLDISSRCYFNYTFSPRKVCKEGMYAKYVTLYTLQRNNTNSFRKGKSPFYEEQMGKDTSWTRCCSCVPGLLNIL